VNLSPEDAERVRRAIANPRGPMVVHARTATVLYSRPQTPEERRRGANVTVLLIGASTDFHARARAGLGPTPFPDRGD
jgi:hypothetical protein